MRWKAAAVAWLVGVLSSAAAVAPGGAAGAEPTLYELPQATHAYSFSVGADGTLWWAPIRGSEYGGPSGPVVGAVSATGTVGELTVEAPGTITATAVAPDGRLWVALRRRIAPGVTVLQIGRVSASGQLERRFGVGRGGGWIGSLSATADAVWFIAHRDDGAESITRVATADGTMRRVRLGPDCGSEALAAAGRSVWFTEACDHQGRKGKSTRSSIVRIDPAGRIVRYPIARRDRLVSLAIGSGGTVWFGADGWDYAATPRVGRITRSGRVVEYAIPHGEPDSIAVGGDGRLWFASSRSLYRSRYLDSIGAGGDRGRPVCGEPACYLEPVELTAAPDGSLWYGLDKPIPLEAGGGALISWAEERANEAGFIGRLSP
ncbi:MAG: hypothetical protein JSS97_12755 [Actinobacteria bacterium]|nr:hypothetical protein [Actinomycetota bacterium]